MTFEYGQSNYKLVFLPNFRCLLTATRLCSRLQLHDRVGEVLSPLTQLLFSAAAAGANRKGGFSGSTAVSLAAVQAMETVMEDALELGSQAEDCWKHIMRSGKKLIIIESSSSLIKTLAACMGNAFLSRVID